MELGRGKKKTSQVFKNKMSLGRTVLQVNPTDKQRLYDWILISRSQLTKGRLIVISIIFDFFI